MAKGQSVNLYRRLLSDGKGAKCESLYGRLLSDGKGMKCEYLWKAAVWWQWGSVNFYGKPRGKNDC